MLSISITHFLPSGGRGMLSRPEFTNSAKLSGNRPFFCINTRNCRVRKGSGCPSTFWRRVFSARAVTYAGGGGDLGALGVVGAGACDAARGVGSTTAAAESVDDGAPALTGAAASCFLQPHTQAHRAKNRFRVLFIANQTPLDSLSSNSCVDQVKFSVLSVSSLLLLKESKSEARGESTEKYKPINPLGSGGGGLRRASLVGVTHPSSGKP